jgi:diamine N-acetyltransferase
MVALKSIDRTNYDKIVKLSVNDKQDYFVENNTLSLAQAYAEKECIPLAIYLEDTPIGFMMYSLDIKEKEYWINEFMIDKQYQSKGYGRQALTLMIEKIQKDKKHHNIYLSFEPHNEWAKKLYESFGFVCDNRYIDNEIVYKLTY